jgi:hypothetical protein
MSDMTDAILKLSDHDAINLLRSITEGVGAASPSRNDREAATTLALDDPRPVPDDADAARLALCLLAAERKHGEQIQAMVANPAARRLAIDPITGTLLASGLMLALQTHVEFARNTDGKWSLKVIKKPSNASLIGPLIKKLAALMK